MTYQAISAYCRKRVGQEAEHDRCYGRGGEYLECSCPCHERAGAT